MEHGAALVGHYSISLVALSVFIAMLAAYAALDLAGRVTYAQGRGRFWWLSGGASAMGIGIWSMHYIGMLAFRLPVPVRYDWPTVLLSLLAAILASGIGLFVVSRRTMRLPAAILGSLFMGGGIAAMHYIGMEAMRLPAMCVYSPWLVFWSVAVAVVIAFAALTRAFAFRETATSWSLRKVVNALILGAAIPTMHYLGMAAASFVPSPLDPGTLRHAISISDLTFAGITLVSIMVLCLVFLTSTVDRNFSRQAMELKSSELRYRKIVETAFDAFLGIDQSGVVTDWNAQAEAAFGWTRAEAIGKPVTEMISIGGTGGSVLESLREHLAPAESSRLQGRVEVAARHRDGHEFSAEMAISSIQFGGKSLFAAFVHDVTGRKLAEREQEEAKQAAEAANHAKSEFLANMSHEIRTPLNGIIGMTDLVLETELTPEQREYLETVELSADALLSVINDVLDFSKIEARKIDLEETEFDLRECMEDTLKTLALRADEKGLELLCDIAADVPEMVMGDPGRLRQIVMNLAGNAVKFTSKGEVGLHVEAEKMEGERCTLHFVISDTGIGIAQEKLERIFESFAQADTSTTREYGGTGLGLTISRHLIEIMGGRIWLESELGKGSNFHFTLQLNRVRSKPAPERSFHAPQPLDGVKVLVIDDNKTNRRILEGLLSGWGMQPTLVADGEQALAHLDQTRTGGNEYRLILTDMQMPRMDGFSLVERIRQAGGSPAATIMMLSSAGHRGDAARCQKLGVAAYLLKPIRQAELREAIIRVLGAAEQSGVGAVVTRDSLRMERDPSESLKVLLVEDNGVNQILAVRMLEKRGHEVVMVSNGRDALAALEKKSYDLVLMDVQMPGLDGIETTMLLRKREKLAGGHQPIVAMTALVMKGDRERCMAAGMDGYLPKPIRADELDRILEEYVESKKRRIAVPQRAHSSIAAEELLDRIGGDRAFLFELTEVFRNDYPRQLRALQHAIANKDAAGLKRSSHELKGVLANLAAVDAREAAATLERLGSSGEMEGAGKILQGLERELDRVLESLVSLCQETVP